MTGLWGRVAAVHVRGGMRGLDTYDRWYQTEGKTQDCGEPVAANLHGGFGGGDAETCAPQGVRARRVSIQSIRSRLASLTRKCRHAAARLETLEEGMYLIGCSYNLCFPHHELSKTAHFGCPTTPAMAASLTDHIWSMRELLMYKIAPSPFLARKQAKRSRKSLVSDPTVPKRPRG